MIYLLSKHKRQLIEYAYGTIVCASHEIDRIKDDRKVESFTQRQVNLLTEADGHLVAASAKLNEVLAECER